MSRLLLSPKYLWLLAGVLLLPALLIHLGMMTFIGDEGIRANVALEMLLSGNYLVPTINGEPYLNKPPLYNWILALSFTFFGTANEWTARLPTVVFLLAYASLCVWYLRRYVPFWQALLVGAMLITCGRILFWDSLLGLIDICFSMVVFALFLWVFHWSERAQWKRMFVGSWVLAAVAFMLKGLPALVFQVLTVGAWILFLSWEQMRTFRGALRNAFVRGLSWPNWLGMGVAMALLGTYYALYARHEPLQPLLERLFTESTKRTAVQYGIGRTILHLFTFPFEMVYHFFPWSLLSAILFVPGVFRSMWPHRLCAFFLVTILANIWVYWISVEVYPRYLLMFLPMAFFLFVHGYVRDACRSPFGKWVHRLFVTFGLLASLGALAPVFLSDRLAQVPFRVPVALSLFLLSAWMTWHLIQKSVRIQLPAMVVLLLVVRLGFDWFVLPDRLREDWGTLVRRTTVETAQKARAEGQRLWLYRDTWIPATNSFYLSVHTGQIVRRAADPERVSGWMIVDTTQYRVPLQPKATFKIRHGRRAMVVGPCVPRNQVGDDK